MPRVKYVLQINTFWKFDINIFKVLGTSIKKCVKITEMGMFLQSHRIVEYMSKGAEET
jgi:hypothetical protein